jgi:hypothetical protein
VVRRGAGGLRRLGHRLAHVGVAAQHTESAARDGAGDRLAPGLRQSGVARTQEDEVSVGQPAQQGGGLGGVVGGVGVGARGGAGARQFVEPAGQFEHPHVEPLGVLVDGPDIVEHRAQPVDEVGRGLLVQRTVEDDGHPGLGERVGATADRQAAVAERLDPPAQVAPHDDHRVHDVGESEALPNHLGGHRVHQVGHVVDDQPDDGSPVGQALRVDGRRPGRPHLGEPQVAQGQLRQLRGFVAEHLGRRLAPVVPLQQRGDVVGGAAGGKGAVPRPCHVGRTGQEPALLVPGGLERGEFGQGSGRGAAVRSVHRGLRCDGGAGHVRPRYCEGRYPSRRRGGRTRAVPSIRPGTPRQRSSS